MYTCSTMISFAAMPSDLDKLNSNIVYNLNSIRATQDFVEFLNECFLNESNSYLADGTDKDLRIEYLYIQALYYENKYDEIAKYLAGNEYMLCCWRNIQTRAFETKNYILKQSGYVTDTTGAYKISYLATLNGTMTYNGNTYVITNARSNLTLNSATLATSGVSFYTPPYLGETSTNAAISSNKASVVYSARFRVYAYMTGNGIGPIQKLIKFKNVTITSPSQRP